MSETPEQYGDTVDGVLGELEAARAELRELAEQNSTTPTSEAERIHLEQLRAERDRVNREIEFEKRVAAGRAPVAPVIPTPPSSFVPPVIPEPEAQDNDNSTEDVEGKGE